MEAKNYLSTSWLNGKHEINYYDVEINTSLSYIAFDEKQLFDGGYFLQGDEADRVIDEINAIYNENEISVAEAIQIWVNNNLC